MFSKSSQIILAGLIFLFGWQLSFAEGNSIPHSLSNAMACNGSFVETSLWQDTVNYCKTPTGDNGQGLVTMINIGASPNPYAYVVTDTSGNILGLPSGNQIDFTGTPPGECWIYGLSYTGALTATLGQNIFNTSLSDSCFDLSRNFVVVIRDSVDGGNIETERRGTDTLNICLYGVGRKNFNFDSTNTGTGLFTYLVTDSSGQILGIPPGDFVDFRNAGPGICYVWGLNYTGNLTATVGSNALSSNLSDDCFDLSDNFIVVVRDRAIGGTVQSELGPDTLQVCYNGGTPLVYAFDSVNTMGRNFTYVVTDNQGVIVGIPPGDQVDFSGAGPGECWVWGLSYTGAFIGAVGDTITNYGLCLGCFELSDNFIVVFRDSVDAGIIKSETNGPNDIYLCYNDPTSPTAFRFDSLGTFGSNFTYVVTDAQGTILGLPPGDMVNFAGAGPGECWVWGLSYTGNLTAMVGDNATQTSLSDGCSDLSDNFIRVFRDSVSGGMVGSELGPDTLTVCYNGGTPTVFAFDSTMATGPNFTYVVTDAQGTILGLPPGDMVNFAGAGPGECWVWGLSYTGNLTAMAGDNATQVALSDGCFDLSDNFVVVFRDSVSGGMVGSELGPDTLTVCYNGGTPTVFAFDSTMATGPNFTYVVTDAQGTILGLPPGDMVNFAGAGPGECWVWGLSYTGNLTAMAGDNATQVALSDGCFDLSDNFVVVFRDSVSGGMVGSELGPDTLTVCYNGGTPTVFAFDSTMATGPNFTYVVTDAQGTILGLPPGDMVNFAGAGPGECWVWGLSYTGNLTAMAGDNATQVALSDGCFDLSDNFVVVFRDEVDAGIIKSETNGPDDLYVCYNDPNATTSFRFDSLGHSNGNFAYVVTDAQGTILGLPPGDMVNFAGAGPGECWVWGLAYTGNLTAMVGDDATQASLSDGCFDLSDNFIRVFRDSLDGGMVVAESGADTLLVCYGGTTPTTYAFDSLMTLGDSFTYVVTDNQGVILGLPPGDMVDFTGAGPGECWVWGLSYSGTLTATIGDTAGTVALSDGCFDLSDNFVVVLRDSSGVACGNNLNGGGTISQAVTYPNPSTDLLNLEIPAADLSQSQLRVSIFQMDGRRMMETEETIDPSLDYQSTISITDLQPGYYMMRVQNGAAVYQTVVVKQ